jgi:hypothetical protein
VKTYKVHYYCPVDINVSALYEKDYQGINEDDVRQKFNQDFPEPEVYIKDVELVAK